MATDLAGVMRQAAVGRQIVRLADWPELWQRIMDDGFVPVSNAFGVIDLKYLAQLGEEPVTHVRRVYFSRGGKWEHIDWVEM